MCRSRTFPRKSADRDRRQIGQRNIIWFISLRWHLEVLPFKGPPMGAAAAAAQRAAINTQRSSFHECMQSWATERSIVIASFIVATHSGVRVDQGLSD